MPLRGWTQPLGLILRIYYLDEPLDNDELEFLKEVMCEWETFKTIQEIEQIRVPAVFPTRNTEGMYDGSIGDNIELVKNNLLKAGIADDIGTQVVLVQPKELFWGASCTTAIGDITGFLPYVIQRWFLDNETDEWYRDEPRVIDSHGAFGLK